MKYNVSYVRNDVPQTILVEAETEFDAREYFKEYKPDASIYGVDEATGDDMRPGKPVLTVPEGWEPKPIWVENKYLDVILEKYGLDKPSSPEFCYQMLSRLKSDCNYYLGNGNRFAGHLWAGNERDHITLMKAMWEKFTDDAKPEWLTYKDLLEYEGKMCGVEVFFTFGSSEKFPFQMGYVSITAPSVQMAIEEFRRNYPDVNKGTLNCADYYWREDSKARIKEHGNGAGCHRAIVVESKDLSVDEIIAGATSRSGSRDKDTKSEVEFDK